jgi:hypothetical protein
MALLNVYLFFLFNGSILGSLFWFLFLLLALLFGVLAATVIRT